MTSNYRKIFKIILCLVSILAPFYQYAQVNINQVFLNDYKDITWKKVEEKEARCFVKNSKGELIAGLWGECGIISSTDNGENWRFTNLPNPSNHIKSIAITSIDVLYAISGDWKLYTSNDNGENWIQLFKDSTNIEFVDVAINSKDDIYLGTKKGLFYISNNENLISCNLNYWGNYINFVHIDKGNDILFVWIGDEIFRSIDNGNSWEVASNGLTNVGLNGIIFNSLGESYSGGAGPNGGLFVSRNMGDSWESTPYMFKQLGDSVITSLAFSSKGEVYFSTFGIGIQVLSKDEKLVTPIISPTNQQIFSIYFTPDGHLIAGTKVGTFKTHQMLSSAIEELVNYFTLEQNYPNPFILNTIIEYTISNETNVILTIMDANGRHITTLVNKKQQRGKHSVVWYPEENLSGMYFYKLETDCNSEFKRMLRVN